MSSIIRVPITLVKNHPENPRKISPQDFEKLKKSIQDFPEMLEKRPLICYSDNGRYITIGGNKRLRAAKAIGLTEIPIILADEWTTAKRKEFLIKDNISAGAWDETELLENWNTEQLNEWGLSLKPPDPPKPVFVELTHRYALHKKDALFYVSMYKTNHKAGIPLEVFKRDPANAKRVSFYPIEFINGFFKQKKGIAIITTPRRSHTKKNGFHFATAMCREISANTGIPFYPDIVTAPNRNKFETSFTLTRPLRENNIILVDDILTTGITIADTITLLQGKQVTVIIAINNH